MSKKKNSNLHQIFVVKRIQTVVERAFVAICALNIKVLKYKSGIVIYYILSYPTH
jgi:hypothetical protein